MKNERLTKFEDFTNLYSLEKTLRFSLIPVEGTDTEYLQKIIREDERRAEYYKQVKKYIDEYHKWFINQSLSKFQFQYEDNKKQNSLSEYYLYYHLNNKADSEKRKKALNTIQSNLRKQIAKFLTSQEAYKDIYKQPLITEALPAFIQDESKKVIIQEFNKFTSYFSGFHENRKNIYSEEEKSTAIAFRIVHENLPRFIDNMYVFDIIRALPEFEESIRNICQSFADKLTVASLQEVFALPYFNQVLTQSQIEIYNAIIGGKTEEKQEVKIQGLNEYINLYNQQHKEKRIPLFKPLYKQILSDREAISWLPETFKTDKELFDSIREYYTILISVLENKENKQAHSFKEFIQLLNDPAILKGIYIRNDTQLTDISQREFKDWGLIRKAIEADYEKKTPQKKSQSYEKYNEQKEKYWKSSDSFSIAFINRCVSEYLNREIRLENYFLSLGCVNNESVQLENWIARIKNRYTDIEDLLLSERQENNLIRNEEAIEKIKLFLDTIKGFQAFIRPLLGKGDETDRAVIFYNEQTWFWDTIVSINPLYDKVRNYLTRKPYSTEKIKLNFENPTLLSGWDSNKEQDYLSVLFKKDNLYYLGIMNKQHRKIFESKNIPDDTAFYEKMEYKFFKDVTTMIPKCSTQLKDVQNHFKNSCEDYILKGKGFIQPLKITKEIYDLNNVTYEGKKKFQLDYLRQTGDTDGFNRAVTTWIQFCMEFLKVYPSTVIYDLSGLKPIEAYKQLDEFYADVNKLLYSISFRNISEKYIHQLVKEGKLFLFQIYSKDFSEHSKGTPNLHTLYWKMLFDADNLTDVVYKLNGQAEVFFRKKSLSYDKPTHPAHVPIKNKNKNSEKGERILPYDLIKDKRYTKDCYLFHVPITINFKQDKDAFLNEKVRDYLKYNENPYIIGIDRGERHLIYISVIDNQGNIVEQCSLNKIINEYNGETYTTDYHDLLNQKASQLDEARKNWKTIENIKELKEGYLSQVIHKITKLMIRYKAIVVLEDLNMGFKRSRQGVETQVYQKFEKMLIDKLNYLANKKLDKNQAGGLLHAYQLTNKFESFKKLNKQSGFLFYVDAWNTSKIDPVSGFINLFDLKYESVEKSKAFFSKFKSIRYNPERDWFEFVFDYNDFHKKAEGTRTEWMVCSYGTRILTCRNPEKNNLWDSEEIDLTKAFKQLFAKFQIDLNGNLKEAVSEQSGKAFFYQESIKETKGLLQLFKLLMQMRNSIPNTETDYLISPVPNKHGICYDSRRNDSSLPKDADANGAYNIARKGLLLIERIRQSSDLKNLSLNITRKEWLLFAQRNNG